MHPTTRVLPLLLLTLSGCAWHGQTGSSFYHPEEYAIQKNIVLGYIDGRPPLPVRYGLSVDYFLNIDSYKQVLEKELRAQFKTVRLIKRPSDCPECLLYATPGADLVINQHRDTYDGEMAVRFDLPGGETLGRIKVSTHGNASPTASMNQLTAVNTLAMGLLAAPSIDQYGNFLINIGEQAIGEMVSDVGEKLATDPLYSESTILYYQPEAVRKRREINTLKCKESMVVAAQCTLRAISKMDDNISDAQTVAVAAGQRCRNQLETWGHYLCLSNELEGYCNGIIQNLTNISTLHKLIVPQVLEYRRRKNIQPKIQTQTIIIPLIVPEGVLRHSRPRAPLKSKRKPGFMPI